MSRFVLTAQLQLQAPNNVAQVVSQIQNQLNNISVNVQVQGSAQANQQLQQITRSTQAATTAAGRMGNAFAVSIRRFAAFSIATRAVGLFTSTLSDAVKTAIDFERELIKISQVTGRSVSSLRDLTDSVTNLSTNLGVTSQSLLEVTTVLTQAGLSSEDTKIALESLAKAALAPNFDSIQETAEGAIAILAQFKQGVGALEGQLSSIDAVAGAFAVEAGDLIDVIRRSGGVFKASGGSLNELLALFTSVRATTRESAESIGTGLRTIFTRIQRPETIEFLKQFGVELVDLNGKFVGPYEAIRKLSEALSGLGEGDLTFISIAEELGGFRQIGKVLPLLQQFSTAQAALNVAQNASNGLTKNAETAQASLAIRIIKVREEFLALVRSMTETPTFQIMANAALSLASALIKIADSIKPLLPLLGAVAAFRAVRGIGGFLGGVGAGLTSGRTFHSGGKVHAFATGGLVPGTGNSDTVPAMLTPGEFVIRKSSVAKLGAENLAHMNKGGLVQKFALGGQARKFGVASLLPMNNPPEEVQATIPVSSIRKYLAKKAGGKSIVKKGNLENVNNTIRGILGLKGQESIKTSAIAETMSRQDVASKIENRVELSIQKLIDNAASALGKSLSINVERKADNSIVKSVGSASTIGSVFEGALSMLGAPMDTGKGEQDPIDFPRGLGSNFANVFPSLSGIPVDAKRTASKKILKDTASRKAAAYLANAVYADPRWTMLSQNKEIKETSKPLVLAQAKRKSPAKISPIDPRRLVNFTSGQTYNFTDITAAGIQPSQANQEFEKLGSGKWRKKHFGGIIEHFAVGGNVGTDTVPALLTPGEFVVNKASAQRIGYGNLHRMNTVGKYAKGGVVQTFANGGTPTGGTRSVISNIPVPGFDTKAPTLLNKVIGQLTGTFSIVDIDLKKGSQQFKLLQTITPDLAKSLMDYAQASNLNVKQTGQLASAYSKLVGTMLMQGDKDSQIVASMQPYVDALKADTNAKLNSAKATAAIGPINATASKFPSPAPSASPAQTSLFPPIIKQPPSSPPSGPSGPTSSSSAVSANTTAIASNTQAQKSAAQSAIGVVRNNKMFAASMATSLIGGFLPAVDENSGAILRVTQSLFSMTTAIFGTLAALEAMNISLNKQTLSNMLDLFSGKGGAIASKVGQFAGNALGGTKVGGMIAPMGNLGGGLGAKAVQTSVTQAVTAIGGIVGPLVGATAAFFAIQTAGNALTEAFMNYEGRLKKEKDTGNIEGARKIATEQQSSKTAVNAVAGTVSGAIVGSLLTPILGPFGAQLGAAAGGLIAKSLSDLPEYAGQVAASQAATIKAQNSLAKASEDATTALSNFEKGNISATEFIKSTSGAANDVATAQAESKKLNEQSQKEISREGDFGGLRGGLRNVVTLGGLIGESIVEKQARIESEQQKSTADVSKAENQLITSSQPILNAVSGDVAAAGGSFEDVLSRIEVDNKGLYDALLNQGTKPLSDAFNNIKKEVERAQQAFNAMNLGMQNVQGAAAAAALGVTNYVAAQQAGNVGLEQSLAVLEASVTSAAQGISDADFGKALSDADKTLASFGASKEQREKFSGNISAVNEVQKNQSSIFGGAKEKLAENIRASSGAKGRREAFSKSIDEQLKASGYDDATRQRFKDATGNMSDDQLKKIGEGGFTAFEESINELGKKTMEQVNGPLKAAIEIQKQLNELTKQRIEAERQLMNAQLEASSVKMEAMDISAKYGGPKVTPQMRTQNTVEQINIQSSGIKGVSNLKTGSAAELSARTQQLSRRQAEISSIRMKAAAGDSSAQQQLQGESGTKLADEEKRISEAAKSQVQATRDLIKSKEEELKIIKEKNQLERNSIDALVSGDIEKFFDQQAAVGAQAAIATGDQRLIGQFGMSALGDAAQETRRQQEAGVQELYGQKLSGPGGLTERAYGSAISAAGIQNPLAMAQVAAGSTGAEAAVESDIRDLAATMGPAADVQVQAANSQLEAAKLQIDAARAKGQEAVAQMQARQVPNLNAAAGLGLKQGEFAVGKQVIQRENNLSMMQAVHNGISAQASSSKQASSPESVSGGIVKNTSNSSEGQVSGGGLGISVEALNAFASALNNFNTKLTENITNLANTKFEITLNPTNINVNLTGASLLKDLTDTVQTKIYEYVGQEISTYSVGNGGKLVKGNSVLPSAPPMA